MTDIALERVSKRFKSGRVAAVRDLSLHVRDGELMSVVGPSGCGKTTTLRLIAGLERPDSGVVRFGAREVTRHRPRDRNVSLVTEDAAVYPHLSAFDNIAFALRMRGLGRSEVDQRVRVAAEDWRISELLTRKPGSLSAGQRRRLALAKAMAIGSQASVVLLDEPLSHLDAPLRIELRDRLREVHTRESATIILVTHDQEDAMILGDRVAVMVDGVIQQVGPPGEVFDTPRNRFVAGFLGSPPMNFIEGTLSHEHGRFRLTWPGASAFIPLSNRLAHAANSLDTGNRGLTLGVRPEHVVIVPDTQSVESDLTAIVERTVFTGNGAYVRVRVDNTVVLAVRFVERDSPPIGARVKIRIDPAHSHLFEEGPFGAALRTSPAHAPPS